MSCWKWSSQDINSLFLSVWLPLYLPYTLPAFSLFCVHRCVSCWQSSGEYISSVSFFCLSFCLCILSNTLPSFCLSICIYSFVSWRSMNQYNYVYQLSVTVFMSLYWSSICWPCIFVFVCTQPYTIPSICVCVSVCGSICLPCLCMGLRG